MESDGAKLLIRIIMITIAIIIALITLDFLCAIIFKRPLISTKLKDRDGYSGILFDVYHCPDNSSKIVNKGADYDCPSGNNSILDIIDVTENNGDSVCTPERELFFEDKEYKYYFPVTCYGYAMVKFKDQTEETLQDALKDGKVQIQDLDSYKISYVKEKKS